MSSGLKFEGGRTSGGNSAVKDLNSRSVGPISTSPLTFSRIDSSACVAHAFWITCTGRRIPGHGEGDAGRVFESTVGISKEVCADVKGRVCLGSHAKP